MNFVKKYFDFLNESSIPINTGGSQIDCYATDWDNGNLIYISASNIDSSGWILKLLAIFHGLDKSEMIRYNNEVQALMLSSAIKCHNYEFYICKDETSPTDFDTPRWKELANQNPIGSIIKPESQTSLDEFKSIIKNYFPFIYYTNSQNGL